MKTLSTKWMAGMILVTLFTLMVGYVPAFGAGEWYAEYFANVSLSGGPASPATNQVCTSRGRWQSGNGHSRRQFLRPLCPRRMV